MFIVWRRKQVGSNRATTLFTVKYRGPIYDAYGRPVGQGRHNTEGTINSSHWKPLWCRHTGDGRISWTPMLMHSERRNGQPHQQLLFCFPTIRSCCIKDQFIRAAWWYDIEDCLDNFGFYPALGRWVAPQERRSIVSQLREKVPRPTKIGIRDFTAYRIAKEEKLKQMLEEEDRILEQMRQRREERARRRAEEAERMFREAQRIYEEYFGQPSGFGGPQQEDCWSVLGITMYATADQLKARYRQLVMEHHPDRGGDPEMFKRIQTAYEQACACRAM